MSRYIDADALNEILGIGEDCDNCQYSVFAGFCSKGSDFVNACEAIADAPTVDVRENVHGKWDKNKIAFHWKCSECGAAVFDNLGAVFDYTGMESLNFCPNCGAKMERSEE